MTIFVYLQQSGKMKTQEYTRVLFFTILIALSWHHTESVLPSLNSDLLTGTFDILSTDNANAGTRTVVKNIPVSLPKDVPSTRPKFGGNVPSRLPSLAIPSVQDVGREFARASQRIEAEARTVDTASQTFDNVTKGFGPHLITDNEAQELAAFADRMIDTAQATVSRLGVSSRVAKTTALRRIPPDFFPPERFCPFKRKLPCRRGYKYRTIDGSCNNEKNPFWGKTLTPFERFLPPLYDNDLNTPRTKSVIVGRSLPGARHISVRIHGGLKVVDNLLSHFTMEFGQVVSHDIQRNALSKGYLNRNLDCCRNKRQRNCFHIPISSTDPFFRRRCMNFVRALASPSLDCKLGVRQQMNQNTHFLDASFIYGSNTRTMTSLRERRGGLLKTSADNLLPHDPKTFCPSTRQCFKAGDVRVNQQAALMSLQTIWMREHNRIAILLQGLNPGWDDETLFQEARKIVGAEVQHITYKEFLPKLLGSQMMSRFDLNPLPKGQFYTRYNPLVKPMIRNSFSAAAFRVGHSLISDVLSVNKPNSLPVHHKLHSVFLKPDLVYNDGVSSITRGLYENFAHAVDKYLTKEVTNKLFQQNAVARDGQDLAAINIQRGRDHGIADYNTWRDVCRLGVATGFSSLNLHSASVRNLLSQVYDNVFDIDLFTGGVSEEPVSGGGVVGPTFACLIGLQFLALKQGDRFFYESNTNVAFSLPQLNEIKDITMAKIICDNTDVTSIPADVFLKKSPRNPDVSCSGIRGIDLTKWQRACIPVHGGWTGWSAWRTTTSGCRRTRRRTRSCTNPRKNSCGKPCIGKSVETRTETLSSTWSGWSSWSVTNRNCFQIKRRTRTCRKPPSCLTSCPGDSSQTLKTSSRRRSNIFDLTGGGDPCRSDPIRPIDPFPFPRPIDPIPFPRPIELPNPRDPFIRLPNPNIGVML